MSSIRLLNQFTKISTLLVVCASYSIITHAQSVDDCMSASQAEAENVCQRVVENGSQNVDVYWKLSSAQHQNGQHALASKTLDDALKLHRGNAKLVSLQKLIAVSTIEQELIIRSTKINQRSLDKGAVKIACLSKTGPEAILACQQRLSLTGEDGDRIRARLADLQSSQTAAAAPDAAKPAPDAAKLAQEARKQAKSTLVAEVQTILNNFGFTAGSPDGVLGGKTRSALFEFYTTIGKPASTSITAQTLQDLTQEQSKLTSARQLLKRSEQSIEQGNSQVAAEQLADARIASRLLRVPVRHEQAVRTAQNAVLTELTAATSEPAAGTAAKTLAQKVSDDLSEQFNELMGQINILQSQIARKQSDQAEQLDRMRDFF